jgi:dipeptidyl aminopeptidase/acylaminoacyl peptidase
MSRSLLAATAVALLAAAAPTGSSAGGSTTTGLRANGRIAFVEDTGIASMNADGSGAWGVELNVGDTAPAWSPDGTQLAVVTHWAGNAGILVMQPDGSGAHMLTNDGGDRDPAWSPDGSKVVFANGSNLYLVGADGSGRAQLTFATAERWVSRPTWSPDGKKIAYDASLATGGTVIVVDDLTSGRETAITDSATYNSAPAWSPDGGLIAFSSSRDGGSESIYVMQPDGSDVTRLTTAPTFDESPAWSPDGSQIAFSRNGQIWSVARDGTNARQLTTSGNGNSDPAWQPLAPGPAGCTIWGTPANDVLVGSDGNDVICGLSGDDKLIGLAGNDRLLGGDGNDSLAGGLGHDVLIGGNGDDRLDARGGYADGVAGGFGYDTALVSGAGNRLNGVERTVVDRDLAVWRPVTADAAEETNLPVRAVDGDFTDWWNSGSYPTHWIEVDLQGAIDVGRIRLVTPDLPSGASFVVLGRADTDRPFRTLCTRRGPVVDLEQLDCVARRAWHAIRYVRVVVPTGAPPMPWVSWREIGVYAPPVKKTRTHR